MSKLSLAQTEALNVIAVTGKTEGVKANTLASLVKRDLVSENNGVWRVEDANTNVTSASADAQSKREHAARITALTDKIVLPPVEVVVATECTKCCAPVAIDGSGNAKRHASVYRDMNKASRKANKVGDVGEMRSDAVFIEWSERARKRPCPGTGLPVVTYVQSN